MTKKPAISAEKSISVEDETSMGTGVHWKNDLLNLFGSPYSAPVFS